MTNVFYKLSFFCAYHKMSAAGSIGSVGILAPKANCCIVSNLQSSKGTTLHQPGHDVAVDKAKEFNFLEKIAAFNSRTNALAKRLQTASICAVTAEAIDYLKNRTFCTPIKSD